MAYNMCVARLCTYVVRLHKAGNTVVIRITPGSLGIKTTSKQT